MQILRDNMPFGNVGAGEYGTYFIGYARSPATIEQMLLNMFVGRPEGNYDRLLDVSHAVTGNLLFVPSVPVLESLAEGGTAGGEQPEPAPAETGSSPGRPARGGSLTIGSLRGESQDG